MERRLVVLAVEALPQHVARLEGALAVAALLAVAGNVGQPQVAAEGRVHRIGGAAQAIGGIAAQRQREVEAEHTLAGVEQEGLARDRAAAVRHQHVDRRRSEEHTSELQSLMRSSYAVFCLQNK